MIELSSQEMAAVVTIEVPAAATDEMVAPTPVPEPMARTTPLRRYRPPPVAPATPPGASTLTVVLDDTAPLTSAKRPSPYPQSMRERSRRRLRVVVFIESFMA